jgi:hypothetical protein
MPQQAAGITAAASCTQSTDGGHHSGSKLPVHGAPLGEMGGAARAGSIGVVGPGRARPWQNRRDCANLRYFVPAWIMTDTQSETSHPALRLPRFALNEMPCQAAGTGPSCLGSSFIRSRS